MFKNHRNSGALVNRVRRTTRLSLESLESRVVFHGDVYATLIFDTNVGDIEIELYDDMAPLTVQNFVDYAEDGDFVNSIMHRVIPGFVVQGGGFTVDSDSSICGVCDNSVVDSRASGSTRYDVYMSASNPIDTNLFGEIPQHAPIVNEFDSGTPNERGTISMARTSNPNSATNQYFINLEDNRFLDNPNIPYAVFGRIVDMSVVDDIAARPRVDISDRFPGSRLGALGAMAVVDDTDWTPIQVNEVRGTSVLHGTVFVDANDSGSYDEGETLREAVTVFNDSNGNGIPDAGEVSTTTDEDGSYHLTLNEAAAYDVRIYDPAYTTSASPYTGEVTLADSVRGLDFGTTPSPSWHNPQLAEDVDGSGLIAPLDVLRIINELNLRTFSDPSTGELVSAASTENLSFFDVNSNGTVEPLDALRVINVLNTSSVAATSSATSSAFVSATANSTSNGTGLSPIVVDRDSLEADEEHERLIDVVMQSL